VDLENLLDSIVVDVQFYLRCKVHVFVGTISCFFTLYLQCWEYVLSRGQVSKATEPDCIDSSLIFILCYLLMSGGMKSQANSFVSIFSVQTDEWWNTKTSKCWSRDQLCFPLTSVFCPGKYKLVYFVIERDIQTISSVIILFFPLMRAFISDFLLCKVSIIRESEIKRL
jgi:hypothetical protein